MKTKIKDKVDILEGTTVIDGGVDFNPLTNKDGFNIGWWNCFLSYTDIISFYNSAYDLAFEQMSSAGVRAEEIDYVLDSDFCMREETKEILKSYRNSL